MNEAAVSRLCRLLFIVLLGSVAGCKKSPPPPPSSPPVVSVSRPIEKPVMEYIRYPGNTEALQTVEVRARVRGFLDSIEFTPRQKVNAEDILFIIDLRPFKVAVEQAQAALEARKSQLRFATFDKDRIQKLGENAAERERAEALEKFNSATAAVAEAQANLADAQLNLEYAHIRAPIPGRIGRNMVDIGTLISPNETLLATITNDGFVYCYFNVSEQDVLRLRRRYGIAKEPAKLTELPQTRPADRAPVYLGLMDEKDYPHEGWVDYVAPSVDASTGTISVRAVFPNADGALVPGLFARVQVPLGEPTPALLVTERALGMDQGQRFLLTVNDKNVVVYHRVEVGPLEAGLRVIKEGIGKDEWVIVNGLQRARPDMPVTAERVAMPGTSPAATRPSDRSVSSPESSPTR